MPMTQRTPSDHLIAALREVTREHRMKDVSFTVDNRPLCEVSDLSWVGTGTPASDEELTALLELPVEMEGSPCSRFATSCWKQAMETLATGSGEEDAQAEICQWVTGDHDPMCAAVSLDSTNANFPVFKYPTEVFAQFVNTAKPDLMSLLGPVFLEIKTATAKHLLEVLVQLLERVHVTGVTSEHLRRVVGFGTTGKVAYMLILKRSVDDATRRIREQYTLRTISPFQILHMWRKLSSAALRDDLYFMSEDAFLLSAALSPTAVPLGYCHVKLRNISDTSRIYRVELPNAVVISNHLKAAVGKDATYVVKISKDQNRSQNELGVIGELRNRGVLEAVAPFYFRAVTTSSAGKLLQPYVYKEMQRCSQDVLRAVTIDPQNMAQRGKLHEKDRRGQYWWHCPWPTNPAAQCAVGCRSAIVMAVGRPLLVEDVLTNEIEIRSFLAADLAQIHSAGVLHTDLRPVNLLVFDGRPRIIDYDLAVIGAETTVDLQPGGRSNWMLQLGMVLTGQQDQQWTALMDVMMIRLTITSLAKEGVVEQSESTLSKKSLF